MLVAIRSPGDIGNKNVILCSSAEIKYHAMIEIASEMVWAKSLPQDSGPCLHTTITR